MAFDFAEWLGVTDSALSIVVNLGAIFGSAIGLGYGAYRWLKPKPKKAIPRLGDLSLTDKAIGRSKEIAQIHSAWDKADRVAIVRGQGGIGKTTLARAYAEKHGDGFGGVLWVPAETEASLVAGLLRLAPVLNLPELDKQQDRDKARSLLDALSQETPPWLVIYDNLTDEAALTGWRPNKGVKLLITSRHIEWGGDVAEIKTETLPCKTASDAGPKLLMREARDHGDRAEALVLAQELDGLPLALVVVGGLIRKGYVDFANATKDMERVLSTIAPDYTGVEGRTILAAVKLSYDRLGVDARWVLDLFAWWAPEGLAGRLLTDVPTSELLAHFEEDIPDDLMTLCRDPMRVRGALAELASVSLISGSEDTGYALHRMAAAAVRQLQGDRTAPVSRAAAAVLAASYPAKASAHEIWPECKRLTPHVRALWRAWPILSDLPTLAAETVEQMRTKADERRDDLRQSAAAEYLFNQASIYTEEMADYAEAVALAEASLRLTRARLSDEARRIAVGWSVLGQAYRSAGLPAAAVAAQRENLRLSDAHDHGPEDRATARNNLAQALYALGTQAARIEALELLQAALEIREEAFGPDSPQVGQVLVNIAVSHAVLGDLPAAIAAAERAVPLLPEADPFYGLLLNNLGSCLLKAGQTMAARERLEQALSHRCEIYGREDHPEVKTTASWLVAAHLVLGRRDPRAVHEARKLVDRFGLDWDDLQRKAEQLPDPQ